MAAELPTTHRPIPATAGIGLRAPHFDQVLRERPAAGWFEVHSENFFGAGGRPHEVLEAVRRDYAVSFHGVGLSLGSTDPLNRDHLARLRQLVSHYQPGLVSEHVAWSSFDGVYANDLLPLPYTEEALAHLCQRVDAVQEHLGRRILMENPSTYLAFTDSVIPEAEFLDALAARTGCGLILDLNNLYVNACNHGWDTGAYLARLDGRAVGEFHLAGHTRRAFEDGEVLIDTHNAPVCPAVWALFEQAVSLWGPRPALIEWDSDLPEFRVLQAEAAQAGEIMTRQGRQRHVLAS
ncbi:DUF692 domain-containing protein [Ectothiorhodospiraceae bacterium WFHF3C12]|nr:DUF692 domain-containing protein [Ectothiorhodospiraceae bacterium WFHF3C12]